MMNLGPGWVGSLVRGKSVGSKGELGLVSSPEENGPSWLLARPLASHPATQPAASDDAAVAQLYSHQPPPNNTLHSISLTCSNLLFESFTGAEYFEIGIETASR